MDGAHKSVIFPYDVNQIDLIIEIKAGSYLPGSIRKEETDNVFVNLMITSVEPLHGTASVGLRRATFNINS